MTETGRNVLSRKQETALIALAVGGSVAEAAQRANVSERTVTRWLGTDAFRAEYRAQAQETSRQALTAVLTGQRRAVEVLLRGLDSDTDAVRVRAATRILELGLKLKDDDVEERLTDLEQKLRHREQEAEAQQ